MNKKVKPDSVVAQANSLVEAYHKNPLTIIEQRIILMMASMIDKNQKDFTVQRISVKDLADIIGAKDPNYARIRVICDNIVTKSVRIKRPHGGFLASTWVSSAEYIPNEGVIELTFDQKLTPYLLSLQGHFTTYGLMNALSLKSAYSVRLYELAKKWEGIHKFKYELSEFRKILGANKKTYESYGPFKQKIIAPCVEEVNEHTDVTLSWEEIREGRKVVGVQFRVKPKPKPKKILDSKEPIPEWFASREEPKEEPVAVGANSDVEERRKQLMMKLGYDDSGE